MKRAFIKIKTSTMWQAALIMLLLLAAPAPATAQEVAEDDRVVGVSDDEDLPGDMLDSPIYNPHTASPFFVMGIQAFNNQDYDNAVTFFKRELEQHPDNAYAMYNLVVAQYQVKDIEINKFITEAFNGEHGTIEQVTAKYEKMLSEQGPLAEEWITLIDKALSIMSPLDSANRLKALEEKLDLLDQASSSDEQKIQCLTEMLKLKPTEEGYEKVIALLEEQDDSTALVSISREALEHFPANETFLRWCIQAETDSHNMARMTEIVDRALAADSGCALAHYAKSRLLIDDGDYRGATSHAIEWVEKAKDGTTELLYYVGSLINDDAAVAHVIEQVDLKCKELQEEIDEEEKIDEEEAAEAEKVAPKATQDDVDDDLDIDELLKDEEDSEQDKVNDWFFIKGFLLLYLNNDYDGAVQCFERSYKQFYNIGSLYHGAIAKYCTGKVDEALFMLTKAHSMNFDEETGGKITSPLYLKTSIESNCGLTRELIQDCNAALIITDDDNERFIFYNDLIYAHFLDGNYDKALEAADRALEINDDDSDINFIKGRVLMLMGRTEEGRALLTTVLNDPDMTQDTEALTLAYLGRKSEAKKLLKELEAKQQATSDGDDVAEQESLYNIACAHAMLGNKKQALHYLKRNFEENGLSGINYGYVRLDPDFKNPHKNKEFNSLVDSYEAKWRSGKLEIDLKPYQ